MGESSHTTTTPPFPVVFSSQKGTSMRIVLINMPWASIDVPSLSLGIIRNSVRSILPDADVTVVDANLDYVDWVTARTEFTYGDYTYYSNATYFMGCGDWVFSSALYDDPEWRIAEFEQLHGPSMSRENMRMNMLLHEMAPEFIEELANRVTSLRPDVVGFTSTFQQNVASLAAAKAIKARTPDVVTVIGGANCDGSQGAALHRSFSFIDFVVRGEGEVAFPELLSQLNLQPGLFDHIAGLCWRDDAEESMVNPLDAAPLAASEIVTPDFAGYFERLASSAARQWVEPKLVIEGARGCWWGEKHHCTFCGLNGSFMQFRSKDVGSYYQEIMDLVRQHQVLDIFVVDNILDMGYVDTLLPRIAESGYDLRIQYEIKSNMRHHQLSQLAQSGIHSVQPGIESLSSRVLKLMDKGVSGCHNVRMMRDGESLGLSLSWNYLYGFPGETSDDYLSILDQIPALHHLFPPEGSSRIAIERFSPFFERPELGFGALRADSQYSVTYDLPESDLFDLAYLFTASPQGISSDLADCLDADLREWADSYPESRLTYCDNGSSIVLVNSRPGFAWGVLTLTETVELQLFQLLDQPRSADALTRRLSRSAGRTVSDHEVRTILASWRDLGLVFEDDGRFIHVATESNNQDLLHIDRLHGRWTSEPADDDAASTTAVV